MNDGSKYNKVRQYVQLGYLHKQVASLHMHITLDQNPKTKNYNFVIPFIQQLQYHNYYHILLLW